MMRILMSRRIQPTQTMTQAIFLAILTRNMNRVKIISTPRASITLSGNVALGTMN
jgi:hypothetical protein